MNRKVLVHGAALAALASVAGSSAAQTTVVPDTLVPALGASTVAGAPATTKVIGFTISLKLRHPAELQAYSNGVSDPRSPSFHQWLTPTQIGEQFGASPTTVSTIVSYLRSKGITVVLQTPQRFAILAQGTVAQIQNAFHTTIKDYVGPGQWGRTISYEANAIPLQVPSAWAASVQAITGVQNWLRPKPKTQTLTPTLARGLYGIAPGFALGFRGQGARLGVTNFDGFCLSNIPLFVNAFGLPIPPGGVGSNIHVVTLNGGAQGGPSTGEGDLDIQNELGMAPLADIYDYDNGAPDLPGTLNKELSDNIVDIVSESYGWNLVDFPSIGIAAHAAHLGMSAAGITYMIASGDLGTDIDHDYNCADGEILGVGGTIATVNDTTGARVNEIAWQDGGGGWTTNTGYETFDAARPSWQHGSGIPSSPNLRLEPDIALQAGGPGAFVIFYQGGQAAFDGTSCSSPCFAGGLGVLEQRLLTQGVTNPRMGRIQDLIYAQAGRSDVWFDITSGNNGVLPNGQSSNARPGWDFCCGWGAPNFEGLFNSLLQQIVVTPYFPVSVSTTFGTYIIGDETSLGAADGIAYQIGSANIPQFGQAAAAAISFTIPESTVHLDIDLQATAGGVAGGTNMVWLFNWNTGVFDLIGSAPISTSAFQDKVIHVPSTRTSSYVGPAGEVDMLVRGHMPMRPPYNNGIPSPFTYKLDMVELLAR